MSNAIIPMIELRGIRKSYGRGDGPRVDVLRGVSLSIQAGEFVAIVGASGSGKSTLMHVLGCLDSPTEGTYLFDGKDVSRLDADELAWLRREAFGFVFQGYHLIATESARENVEVPAIYAGMPAAERQSRALQLLERLGMSGRTDHRPSQLSGGQQQRVAIARALMNGGRIILADEPTGALDSQSGREVMTLLNELADAGHTIILITHDRDVAAHARRVIEIRDGNIIHDSGDAGTSMATVPESAPMLWQRASLAGAGVFAEVVDAGRSAWRVMWINRFRTSLTLLGIIIGVASVIVMLAIGRGTQQKVLEDMSMFGTNVMYVSAHFGSARALGGRMTLDDVETIKGVAGVDIAMPYLEGSVTLRRGNIDHRSEAGGATPDFVRALNWKVVEGVFINQDDDAKHAKVAVIGDKVKQVLFEDGSDPVGQQILVNNVPFLVIGVLAPKGALAGDADEDNRIVVPFSTASSRLFGEPYPTWLNVSIRDAGQAAQMEESITEALMRNRSVKDFSIYNNAESVRIQSEANSTMTLMLGLVAAISLLVGGIGVMNVMLMTVRERTREIGIRVATGARQRDIQRQFITEVLLVSVTGGGAGVVMGLGFGVVLVLLDVPMIFSLTAIVLAFSCAVLTGLVFGFVPARRAARMDPVMALASE